MLRFGAAAEQDVHCSGVRKQGGCHERRSSVSIHAVWADSTLEQPIDVGESPSLDRSEEQRGRKEVVLDHAQAFNEMQDLGLRTATAMHHAVDIPSHRLQDLLHHGRVGASG